jgi:RNA polymerase sigma factor (TIGR02999 family)
MYVRKCRTKTTSRYDAYVGDEPRTVTLLLRDWQGGDRAALDELVPRVYRELHRIAAGYVHGERPGHTLRPTDLVSEAYVRLVGSSHPEWNDRVQFYAIAARTMRQVLVDHARKRDAAKRGGGERPIELDDRVGHDARPIELLALDAALLALAEFDERKARVIELQYFGGLTQDEIAKVLGVHVNTVARDLKVAEAWLQRRLGDDAT